jgi:hypothetical protein
VGKIVRAVARRGLGESDMILRRIVGGLHPRSHLPHHSTNAKRVARLGRIYCANYRPGEQSMTTTANAFVANGPAAIGVEARPSFRPHWFEFGVLTVGHTAGVFGQTNDVTTAIPPAANTRAGVWGVAKFDYGVLGQSLSTGIMGEGSSGPGVAGYSSNDSGVRGIGSAAPSVFPPAGFDLRAGVTGQSENYPAVTGFSTNKNGSQGLSINSSGVFGVAGAQGPVPALVNIAGVVGSSDQQTGIIGTSKQIGVYGFCGNADPMKSGIGVYGRADRAFPNNYAGAFEGNVSINGALTLGGDLALLDSTVAAKVKNAVVPFPDGTRRVLHCMESPEHWFEDFGASKLRRGRTVVRLDANFAKVINSRDYKVFVTPEGDCRGLYVRKSAASFEVRELGGGTSSTAFSYRIVGRRKDIKNHQRFAKIDVKPNLEKLFAEMRKRMAKPARRRRRRRGKRA